jgi:UDP-glucose 4-epimerase
MEECATCTARVPFAWSGRVGRYHPAVRAVVTGGAGFIGSHLVDSLVADGADVLVLDDLSHGSPTNLAGSPAAELAEVDVRDEAGVRRAVTAFAPELVFHLAAQIDVRKSMRDRPRLGGAHA